MQAALQFPSQHHNGTARQHTDQAEHRHRDQRPGLTEQHHQPSRQQHNGYADDSPRAHKARRVRSPERVSTADHHGSNRHLNGSDRHHNDSRQRDMDYRQHQSDRHEGQTRARHAGDAHPDPMVERHSREQNAGRQSEKDGTQYGLSWGDSAPAHLRADDRQGSCHVCMQQLDCHTAAECLHTRM